MIRIAPSIVAGVAVLAIAPAAAQAATKPSVSTGLAGSVTPQSATLTGAVNPGGSKTTYRFDYGATTKYGAKSASASAGAGTSSVAAVAGVTGLPSGSLYHYRLVAHNAKGTVNGADRTFRTPKQPLGFAVAANPTQIALGGSTTIAGTLGGTGSANRQVLLQQNPWPFTAGFQTVGNPQLTTATGAFGFPLLGLTLNTQYRVITAGKSPVVSPTVTSQVLTDATIHVGTKHVNRDARLRFSGHVHPAKVGALIGVQRLAGSKWKTVKGSTTHKGGTTYATYATRAKISKGGKYRVFVQITDGSLQSHFSPSVTIHTRRG